LTFFGLTKNSAPKFRSRLFEEIHEIVYHGNGGYDWHTVYDMPIWLRKFTYKQILDFLKNKGEQNTPENTAIGADGLVKNKQIFKSKVIQPKFNPQNGPRRPSTYK
jgi:hypothetical protein